MGLPNDQPYSAPTKTARGRPVIPIIPAIIVGIVVLGIIGGIVALIMLSGDGGQIEETPLADILDNPSAYEGKDVVTVGTVDTILSDRAFTLSSLNTLVLLQSDGTQSTVPTRNGRVFIRGEVVDFDLASARQRTGLALPDATFGRFEGEPAFIAVAISSNLDAVRNVEVGAGR